MHRAQPFGAAPAVAVLEQEFLGVSAGRCQRRFQTLRYRGAQFALAPRIGLGERFKLDGERRAVDEFSAGAGRTVNIQHDVNAIAERPVTVTVQCLEKQKTRFWRQSKGAKRFSNILDYAGIYCLLVGVIGVP